MLSGKRIVVCVPYGRRRTVSILMNYLRRDQGIVDEVQLWMNTDASGQEEDVAWAHDQAAIYGGWLVLKELPTSIPLMPSVPARPSTPIARVAPKQLNTAVFYEYAQEPRTLYFRFDDDIVYVHPRYFAEMVAFREAHPEHLLVFGNIWNNAVISYLHQRAGRIGREHGVVESPFCMDPVGWRSPIFADYIHRELIGAIRDGTVDRFLFDEPYKLENTRFSISNFVWRGEDCREWGGATGVTREPGAWPESLPGRAPRQPERDEEIFLTEVYPRLSGLGNVVCGRGLVSHYSFFDQRPALDQTDILEQYRQLSQDALSGAYYDLLGASG